MNLYILRHADAAKRDEEKFADDNQRPLVKKGKNKTDKMARFLRKRKSRVSLILTSPSLRCLEAAKRIRKELKLSKEQVITLDCLLPEGSNADLIADIKNKYLVDSLLVVGHDPDLPLVDTRYGADLGAVAAAIGASASVSDDVGALVRALAAELAPGDHVLVMSNGDFCGVHVRLLEALAAR